MRKIQFNNETIEKIQKFISEGHTMAETCNKFTLKYDTLKRVMFEHNIQPCLIRNQKNLIQVTDELEQQACSLFNNLNMRMQDISAELKIPDYMLQSILKKHYTQEQLDKKHAMLYRNSKLGNKNSMKKLTDENHPNFKGLIDDGAGYLICIKPEWFTGRQSKAYVYVHHIEYCLATGLTEIPKGFIIHHIDGNKRNNDISNLAMMSMGAHAKLHALLNRMSKVQRLSNNGVGESRNAEH